MNASNSASTSLTPADDARGAALIVSASRAVARRGLRSTGAALLLAIVGSPLALASPGDPVEAWRTTLPQFTGHSALDSQGNMVLSGAGESLSMGTLKVAPDGTVLWTQDFDVPGSILVPVWIAVDSQDNVIHGGYAEGSSGGPWGFLAVKYDPDGNFLWSAFGSDRGQARRLAVDEFDDVYMFGEVWGGLSGLEPTGNDFLTVKIGSDGTPIWQRTAHGTGSDEPFGLDAGSGIVAVTGHASSPFMTVAYDYAGNELWKEFYADGIWGAADVVVGPSGEVVVCGWGTTFGTFPYVGTVVKYDAAGNELWRVLHNGPDDMDNMRRLAIDQNGDIAAVGFNAWGWVTWKIDSGGTLLWARYWNGTDQPYSETPKMPAIGSTGEVYVIGMGGPSCVGIGLEGYALKYSADGVEEWSFPLACSWPPHSFSIDATGDLLIGTSKEAIRVHESGGPPAPWVDLAHGLAGTAGEPVLTGTGTLVAATSVTLALGNALPLAPSTLVVGLSSIDAPFKGGVMVPNPDVLLSMTSDGLGEATLAGLWPSGVPSGFTFFCQWWIQDPGGPVGFAASNGLAATQP